MRRLKYRAVITLFALVVFALPVTVPTVSRAEAPAVDPAAPPITIANESNNFADSLQLGKFCTDENPVHVIAEIN